MRPSSSVEENSLPPSGVEENSLLVSKPAKESKMKRDSTSKGPEPKNKVARKPNKDVITLSMDSVQLLKRRRRRRRG